MLILKIAYRSFWCTVKNQSALCTLFPWSQENNRGGSYFSFRKEKAKINFARLSNHIPESPQPVLYSTFPANSTPNSSRTPSAAVREAYSSNLSSGVTRVTLDLP